MTRTITGAVCAVLVLSGCSDAAGPSGDHLSRSEALVLASDLTVRSEQTTTASSSRSSSLGTNADPTTITHELELTHPCPRGGQLKQSWKATATLDLPTGSLELDLAGQQEHVDCAYQHEGVTITVDGDPDIDFSAHAALSNHQPTGEHTFEVSGAFKWSSSDGRSGTCPVTLNAVTDWAAKKKTVEGDVCGHTIKETTTWS